ncbi:MAG: 1-phosphofructokinase family hexose kinase [Candidatus Odinarchaeota archaeon]
MSRKKSINRPVLTVTLNPALDNTVYLLEFVRGKTNRVEKSTTDPGGKGVNVTKGLLNLNIDSLATGILPAAGSDVYLNLLREKDYPNHFLLLPDGKLRQNYKIIEQNGVLTEINEKGEQLSAEVVPYFLHFFSGLLEDCQAVALSGSIPPGLPSTIYQQLIRLAADKSILVALDFSGEPLIEALKLNHSSPVIIHLNREEIEEMGVDYDGEEIQVWAREHGINWLVITDGENGGWAVTRASIYKFQPPIVNVISPVAAGDVLLAALMEGFIYKKAFDKALRFAVAYATATTMAPGSSIATKEQALKLVKCIKIIPG